VQPYGEREGLLVQNGDLSRVTPAPSSQGVPKFAESEDSPDPTFARLEPIAQKNQPFT